MALNTFDGSGNFVRTFPEGGWKGDAAANIPIRSDRHDDHDQAMANALSNMICKDGQSTVLANIPFNGKRIIALGDPVNPQDAMTLKSFSDKGVRVDASQSLTLAQQLQVHTNINDLSSVLPKAAAYTLLPTDRSKLLYVTAASTITLPPAANVGNDYSVYFRANGGKITLDAPPGVLIEGLNADYIIPDITNGAIYCDGVNWQVVFSRSADTSFQGPYRNKLINGGFDIWTRATTQTTNGYGSDDRWTNQHVGTTKTHTQALFTLGQTAVPGNPKYYSTTTWTSVVGVNNFCIKVQHIEDVRTLSGKQATLTFWAVATANRDIAIEISQSFGTGGTPSAVASTPLGKKSITTSWAKYQIVFDVPSIAGKILGTAGNDCLSLFFWFDAGSNFATRASNVGQTSGSVSLARVSLVEGDASGEPDPFAPRHYAEELKLCERYCERGFGPIWSGQTVAAAGYYIGYQFRTLKRGIGGTITFTNSAAAGFPAAGGSVVNQTQFGVNELRVALITSGNANWCSSYLSEDEL